MLDDFGQRIRDIILSEMDLSRELSDEEICDLIGSVVSREARDRPMTIKDRAELERTIFNSLRKLDVLQELVDDRDVTEIMVNGPNDIFYEKAGRNAHVEQWQFDVFVYVQFVNQVEALEYETNDTFTQAGALCFSVFGDFLSIEVVFSARRVIEQAKDIQQCRFTATGRSHDCDELTFFHFDVHIVQSPCLHFFCLEDFLQVYCFNHNSDNFN